MPSRRFVLAIFALAPCLAAQIIVRGKVVDESNAPVSGVQIRFSPQASADAVSSSENGEFEARLPSFGRYVIYAAREPFFPVRDHPVEILENHELLIVLNRKQQVVNTVNVSANQADVDLDRNYGEKSLSDAQLINVPFPDDRYLRRAFRLIPGVVQDNRGGVHFAGGAENQVLYTLDGFNVADPVTGVFDSRISVDAVSSVDFYSGYVSPEIGKGSAGAVAIQTKMGDDRLRYTATNFIPGVDMRKGLRMGAFSPRFGASGPLRKGRAWFTDQFDAQYSEFVVNELPKGEDTAGTWQGSNLSRAQINLAPTNIFYASALVNVLRADDTGLGPLDPISTTTDRRARSWFFSLKDQMYLGHGALLDIGLAQKRTLSRQIPQGDGFLELTPNGRTGNAFLNARQTSERDQFVANLALPVMHAMGRHQVRAGIDLDTLDYSQEAHRTGYEQFNSAGLLLWRVTYTGSPTLRVSNSEAAWYIVDTWSPRRNVRVESGVRHDWDRLSDRWALSPRVSTSYAPWTNLRLSAGFSLSRDSASLQTFSRPFDQRTVTSTFNARGLLTGAPVVGPGYTAGRGLGNGEYRTWTFGAERRFSRSLSVNVNGMRKHGDNSPTYVATGNSFVLQNFKRDIYYSAELGIRHQIGSRYEWSLSYVRSGTKSNAVTDINADQTRIVRNNFGRMGWDMPDRLLSFGYLPTPLKRFSIAYLLDTHEGTPFSVDKDGAVVGAVNSQRFPTFFELDLHVESRVTLLKKRLAVRAGFNNITDHFNPTAVNSTMGGTNFMKFYGSDSRHFVVRARVLSRE